MAIQNVMLPDDVFGIGPTGEETGDENTDMTTKDESLKYDESNRPKPSESKFDVGQVSSESKANIPVQEVPKQNEVTQNLDDIPTPAATKSVANPISESSINPTGQINNNIQNNNETDEGEDYQTLKPSFTNPEDVKPSIEVL